MKKKNQQHICMEYNFTRFFVFITLVQIFDRAKKKIDEHGGVCHRHKMSMGMLISYVVSNL